MGKKNKIASSEDEDNLEEDIKQLELTSIPKRKYKAEYILDTDKSLCKLKSIDSNYNKYSVPNMSSCNIAGFKLIKRLCDDLVKAKS